MKAIRSIVTTSPPPTDSDVVAASDVTDVNDQGMCSDSRR